MLVIWLCGSATVIPNGIVFLRDPLGFLAFEQVEQVGVAVEMIEVFEQAEVEGLLDVRIGLGARGEGGQVNGDLLVGDQ